MNAKDFEKPLLELEKSIEELKKIAAAKGGASVSREIVRLAARADEMKKRMYSKLSPWQIVQIARNSKRPFMREIIQHLGMKFIELHGDRSFSDDQAILGGLATMDDLRLVVIGHHKGRTVEENLKRNFGLPHPEGYRKAIRLMRLAEKFRIPVLTFIDTQGAYPGLEAEERGIGQIIGWAIREMSEISVPIICMVTGEGGSGGALAIGVGDRVLMMSNSYYSVCTPEACAAILWHDSSKAEKAADALNLTARDLSRLGIIDEIIPEPVGGAHRDPQSAVAEIKKSIKKHFNSLMKMSVDDLLETRYEKYRVIGKYRENGSKT